MRLWNGHIFYISEWTVKHSPLELLYRVQRILLDVGVEMLVYTKDKSQ